MRLSIYSSALKVNEIVMLFIPMDRVEELAGPQAAKLVNMVFVQAIAAAEDYFLFPGMNRG